MTNREKTRVRLGFCSRCGEPRVTSQYCRKHADEWNAAQRKRRRERAKAGRCQDHPTRPAVTATMCRECADGVSRRCEALKSKRVAAGLCSTCSRPSGRFSQCSVCRKARAEWRRKKQSEFKTYVAAGFHLRATSAASARAQAKDLLESMNLPVPRRIAAVLYDPASDPELAGFVRRAA